MSFNSSFQQLVQERLHLLQDLSLWKVQVKDSTYSWLGYLSIADAFNVFMAWL